MFSGIVEEAGRVDSIAHTPRSIRLGVASRICGRGLRVGDSLAINGCCLTTVQVRRQTRIAHLQFDLLKETWERTNFPALRQGSLVNLERSLQVSDRLGGHFVTGHIDGVGTIRRWERVDKDHVLDISAPPEVMRYIVFKGSVAVDGISLTVAAVKRGAFRIWIIPHTFEVTALQERRVGDLVNLEADLIGKYVERFVATLPRSRARAVR